MQTNMQMSLTLSWVLELTLRKKLLSRVSCKLGLILGWSKQPELDDTSSHLELRQCHQVPQSEGWRDSEDLMRSPGQDLQMWKERSNKEYSRSMLERKITVPITEIKTDHSPPAALSSFLKTPGHWGTRSRALRMYTFLLCSNDNHKVQSLLILKDKGKY